MSKKSLESSIITANEGGSSERFSSQMCKIKNDKTENIPKPTQSGGGG
jgi:hypothetical protein